MTRLKKLLSTKTRKALVATALVTIVGAVGYKLDPALASLIVEIAQSVL